ncbi:MAG: DUF4190 domain-containing protein [Flavobacteriales bacterium]
MRKSLNLISGVLLSVFILSSCGDVGITKRRHLPGYHLDFGHSKKQQKPSVVKQETADRKKVESIKTRPAKLSKKQAANVTLSEVPVPELEASAATKTAHQAKPKNQTWSHLNQFMRNPIGELRKEKLNGELKRAVFNKDEEKYGWSTTGIVSTGLGFVGLGLVITGLVLLVSFVTGAGFAFWWLFLLLGLFIGIGAMVTGIIGMRQTRGGEKRGRGFALAGMIAGIVSLAMGLVGLLWGLIYSIIFNREDDF